MPGEPSGGLRAPTQPSLTLLPRLPPAVHRHGCPEEWTWDPRDCSPEVRLNGARLQTALFHPNWSNGTAGVRGTRSLNRHGAHYWEIHVQRRLFGTSMMFGIATKKARLHVDAFVNLLGEDEHSWGLSHKGMLWHGGRCRPYTRPFRENESTVVGVLYDAIQGTLTFYRDGVCLGIAFSGLHRVLGGLYPAVCSTAAKTEMTLGVTIRAFDSLEDRCRSAIARLLQQNDAIEKLPLPNRVKTDLRTLMQADGQRFSDEGARSLAEGVIACR
ncbi:hypothetical protein CAPTEDRAFT_133111 [Capitella teleta]|uniref:SPRY domain-containing SOCS box protein 3 n=1 Tax=Capitella teleta TaxID=283909 RepID=N1PBD7_CAPTE|nr:hypothetical protein CAPTEDRAFT_133111 [Capitella teleta]|eukprot:ELU18874.1 hypothetical protein CAPTEDRAFT_133111 [Capitella teleta]